MSPLQKSVARFVFYAVALILFAWTASLTYTFVAAALPQMPWFVPIFSLVVFDIGMLAWMLVFLNYSEGPGQRAIAIMTCLFDMIGVALMVIAEILLGGQQLATAPAQLGEYAIWGVGLWTVGNIVSVVLFHLLSPEARKAMALQAEKDEVFTASLEALKKRRVANSARLADGLSESMYRELEADLFADAAPLTDNPPNAPPARPDHHTQPPTIPIAIMPTENGHREEDQRPT